MTEQHGAATLSIVIGLCAVGGLVSLVTDLYPGTFLVVVAVIPAVVFVASYVAFDQLIGESWTTRETVLTMIGVPAMFGAIGFLIAGLLTPRTPDPHVAAGTS